MAKVKVKLVTKVNHMGDHFCPHCRTGFIDPLDCELKVGVTTCRVCDKEYKVTAKIAKTANDNKAKYDKACDRVIKEVCNVS